MTRWLTERSFGEMVCLILVVGMALVGWCPNHKEDK